MAACSARPEAVRVGRVVLDAPPEMDNATIEREKLRLAVTATVDDTVRTEMVEGKGATHVLHVRVGEVVARPMGEGQDAVQLRPVEVRLRPTGQAAMFETVGRGAGTDFATGALSGFEDAWTLLTELRRLDVQDDEGLIGALAKPDARLRDFAIQRLGERRSKLGVDGLCQLLGTETREELVLRAIGALVSIGDPRAVPPLIDLTTRKEAPFVLQIIFAVAAIGGRTAEAFLVTVASGHPSESVQQGAKDALAELERRRRP